MVVIPSVLLWTHLYPSPHGLAGWEAFSDTPVPLLASQELLSSSQDSSVAYCFLAVARKQAYLGLDPTNCLADLREQVRNWSTVTTAVNSHPILRWWECLACPPETSFHVLHLCYMSFHILSISTEWGKGQHWVGKEIPWTTIFFKKVNLHLNSKLRVELWDLS